MIEISKLISERVGNMIPSATLGMAQAARDLKNQGIDVVTLSAGEPDFDTPKCITEIAKRSMDAGKTHYAPVKGTKEIETAMIQKFERDQGVVYAPNQVMCTVGAKSAIMMALDSLLNPGDEVLIPAPFWVSYPVQVALAGGVSKIIHCQSENQYLPTGDEIKKAITKKTKALLLNSPNNPTGGMFDLDQLKGIAKALEGSNVVVISDEINEKVLTPQAKHYSPAAISDDMKARTLVISGASKGYAMTGWRVGFVGGPAPLITAMGNLQGQQTTCLPEFIQDAASFALRENAEINGEIAKMNRAYDERRARALALMAELPQARVFPSRGAFYIWADFSFALNLPGRKIADDVELATLLLKEAHVACVPGTPFGKAGFLRLSIASSISDLETALNRMVAWFSRLK